MLRVIGLMSGTSLDGVDAAWLETDGEAVGAFGPALTLPYDAGLRAALRRILDRAAGLHLDDPALAEVTRRLTEAHVEAVRRIGRPADLIGFHGQTILHDPAQRRTWQIGDAPALARAVGVPVAHAFRAADVAAGGEGAPLVPLFHAALARDLPKPLAVLNIGGVANVTFLGSDGGIAACDTGPGNALLDDWVARRTGRAFDADGALAAAGQVREDAIAALAQPPLFRPPTAEIARPAAVSRRFERPGGGLGGRWGGDARGLHGARGRGLPLGRAAGAVAHHRRRAPQSGDHGGPPRRARCAGGAGRGRGLERGRAGGAMFRLPRRACAARPAAQPADDDGRAAPHAGRRHHRADVKRPVEKTGLFSIGPAGREVPCSLPKRGITS